MDNTGGTRVTVRFPDVVLSRIDEVAKKQFRSRSSVIIEACKNYIISEKVKDATLIAESSPEYQAILKKAKEDFDLEV